MRIVIIGASGVTVQTVNLLLEHDHEVVVIEADQDRIDMLSDTLECGFLHGDGSKPAILEEANAENTDVLLCLSDSDQANIISALVGRELGYQRVILKVTDTDYESICAELKLEDLLVPDAEIGRALARLIEHEETAGAKAEVLGDLRFCTIRIRKKDAGRLSGLDLPKDVRVVAVTRDAASVLPEDDMSLKVDDKVLLLTTEATVETLQADFEKAEGASLNF